MPIYTWKLPYLLLGLTLGYAILLQSDGAPSIPLSLFLLPIALFAAIWIQNKERVLLAIALIDISLHIDRSFHFQDEFLLTRWGYLISILSIALAGLYALWFLKSCLYKVHQSPSTHFSKFHIVVIFYVVSILLSLINSNYIYISSFEVFYQIQCILLYFYLVYYIDDEEKFNFVIKILLLGLFIQVVVVFIQNTTGTEFDLASSDKNHEMTKHVYHGNFEVFRPSGTFQSYNILADYLTTLLFITLGYLFAQKSYLGRFLVSACLLLGTAALLITHSRGGWVGFALGLLVFFIVSLRRRWMSLKVGATMVMVGALCMLPFASRVYFRLTESDGGSGLSRIPLAKLAWNIIADHPWFGVGANVFGVVMEDYITSEIRGEWLYIVHNKFLLIFAEIGLFGIVSFLALMMGMIWLCYRCVKADHHLFSPLALGIIASLICDTFHMMVDILQARSSVETFWTMAALSVVAYRLLDVERPRPGPATATEHSVSKPLTLLPQTSSEHQS